MINYICKMINYIYKRRVDLKLSLKLNFCKSLAWSNQSQLA